ncbi:MAG TPA: dihydroxyacetone kinase family protein [Roseiarcus sp.]
MTFVHDEPEGFAAEALRGFASAYGRYVTLAPGGVLRAAPAPAGKVAVVIGGGSGHYPAFAGYVGAGLADAAVAGDVFASPSTRAIARIARLADRGGGVLLGFGNYAGDVLNFGAAARRLAAEGVDARILPVADDVASAPAESAALRRGVAGDVVVFKIAGAAAEAGMSLDDVERLARIANRRTVSFGVAFRGCTLPGAREPLFVVPDRQMAIGLGIHGEPGVAEEPIVTARALARILVERLVRERPRDASGRVAVMLNGLGATKYEELFGLWSGVQAEIEARGLTIVGPEVGEFVTSLDMAGCSLTIAWLDYGLEQLWLAPADAAAFRRGAEIHAAARAPIETFEDAADIPVSSAPSQASARCVADLLIAIAAAMREAEEELGRIDARAGDGDHGQAMSRGSAAAAEAAERAVAAGAGAASVLALAGDAWADRAGGASGALWGLGLRAWSEAFSDATPIAPPDIARGAWAALEAIVGLGGAKVGDKTLVDAFVPFVTILKQEIAAGRDVAEAWRVAAEAADKAATATASLTPRLGRARPLASRSIGHPDAGAISLALALRLVGERLDARQ